MPKPHRPGRAHAQREVAPDASKEQLQEQLEQTRESIGQTVAEIKGTVEEQIDAVKDTVGGVLAFRDGFKNEPLVWSLGALSAGFALGYTLGYANKRTRFDGRLPPPLAAFVDDLARELSKVGRDLVLPSLNTHIKASLGFDLIDVLEDMGGKPKPKGRAPTKRRSQRKTARPGKRPAGRRSRPKPR